MSLPTVEVIAGVVTEEEQGHIIGKVSLDFFLMRYQQRHRNLNSQVASPWLNHRVEGSTDTYDE